MLKRRKVQTVDVMLNSAGSPEIYGVSDCGGVFRLRMFTPGGTYSALVRIVYVDLEAGPSHWRIKKRSLAGLRIEASAEKAIRVIDDRRHPHAHKRRRKKETKKGVDVA